MFSRPRPALASIGIVLVLMLSGCTGGPSASEILEREYQLIPGQFVYESTQLTAPAFELNVRENGAFGLVERVGNVSLYHEYRAQQALLLHQDSNGDQRRGGLGYFTGVTDRLITLDSALAIWLARGGRVGAPESAALDGVEIRTNGDVVALDFLENAVSYELNLPAGLFPPSKILVESNGSSTEWRRSNVASGSPVALPPAPTLWESGSLSWDRVPKDDTTLLVGRDLSDVVAQAMLNPVVLAFVQTNEDWYLATGGNAPTAYGDVWLLEFQAHCERLFVSVVYPVGGPLPTTVADPQPAGCENFDVAWPGAPEIRIPSLEATMDRFFDVWGVEAPVDRVRYDAPHRFSDVLAPSGEWRIETGDPTHPGHTISFSSRDTNSGFGYAGSSYSGD